MWALAGRPGHDELVVGCDGGSIGMHKLQFQHVTAIYKVRGLDSLFALEAGLGFEMRVLGIPEGSDTPGGLDETYFRDYDEFRGFVMGVFPIWSVGELSNFQHGTTT